jgi:hypothetical protein
MMDAGRMIPHAPLRSEIASTFVGLGKENPMPAMRDFTAEEIALLRKSFGSPGIPVVTGQSSLSHRAKLLEILG